MQAIDAATVHRLCAGQVIVDLATSVKELLENSLDAEATHIEVKLKDSGLTSITITDNGHGIDESSFSTLCRKHWTSKISRFEDLECVSTFGFRGEALSSLCSVAQVTITTATRDSAPMGTELEYDLRGELTKQTPIARERGTTVRLTNLFAKWPVRHQDLKKNIRREYLRLVSLVEQYAIISDNVRVSLVNQTRTGTTTHVRTAVQSDRLTRLLSVIGASLRPHMVRIEHGCTQNSDEVKIDGYISQPIPEAGRSGADKQYLSVNNRPCDVPHIKRLINETYRSYCPAKYPVFAISITLNAQTIDVNLTPDKRTILIRHESLVLDALRNVLGRVLEPVESVFSVNRVQPQIAAPVNIDDEGPSGSAAGVSPVQPQVVAPMQRDDEGTGERTRTAETSVPGVIRCFADDRPESSRKRPANPVPEPNPAHTKKLKDPLPPAPPTRTSRPQPTLPTQPTASKKLQTMVIGNCRNRIQNDTCEWTRTRDRMQRKHARHVAQLEESQERSMDPVDIADDAASGGVQNTDDPEQASRALSRLIHKTDFARMSVIGQFNHGFIVARLHSDLYIVDQHAADEKHNFEHLQHRAIISSQPLIQPSRLELSIVDEAVAIEHQSTLERNGFRIQVDDTKSPGHKVLLLSQPVIGQTVFDQQDFMELVGKLCVCPEAMPRCERARKMFASRACRMSIMVGDPLSLAQMSSVVRHLSELDHPWNCPHGRPTMRHLFRLPT
ncbi:ATP-binding mismatch repair protein [Coemansia sp. RSA 1822]|nr:ATP-binding mismatch repair protein [Coemansia sp. RSA 638]KAJ2543357.1 ATP-binding mismatch repair protein [Coemansia sp. RSA 1853]KAJ2567295.1 ATP-binding mismatch repair protein [Coemansia sp. RSA 1822]